MSTNFFDRFHQFFALHKNEQIGFLVLIAACLVVLGGIYYQQEVRNAERFATLDYETIDLLIEEQRETAQKSYREQNAAQLFNFDPNSLALEGWQKLGFSEKQAASIVKYRSKGGFKVKKDLAKLFVVSDAKYKELEPFILLPSELREEKQHREAQKRFAKGSEKQEIKPLTLLDLNEAELEDLEALPHIGPKTAAQIISFRDLLGGFHDKEQLASVYYLRDKPDAVDDLMKLVVVTPGQVSKINVNEAEAATLADHPFINWKEAKALVNYRKHHGEFEAVENIMECKLITENLFRKIAPYLSVQ